MHAKLRDQGSLVGAVAGLLLHRPLSCVLLSGQVERLPYRCKFKDLDLFTVSVPNVAEFLLAMFERGSLLGNLDGCRSTISVAFPPSQGAGPGISPFVPWPLARPTFELIPLEFVLS